MARPARYKAAQALAKMAGQVTDDTTILNSDDDDNTSEFRTGQVSEAELEVQRSVARRMGWVDKDEWTRDPAKWTDADQFLERTPAEVSSLKDRLKRTGQAADAAIETARRIAREEAEAELRQATLSGNADLAVQAAHKVAQNAGPDPRTVAWIGRNTWFNEDTAARTLAAAICDREASMGASHEEQLERAEKEVRKRFPEYFGETIRESNVEKRLSDVRSAPAVQPGTRGQPTRTRKENGWNEIPSADRQQLAKFVKKMSTHSLDEAAAQARLATSYWANKGN